MNKAKQKFNLKILLIIIVALLIGGAFFGYSQWQANQNSKQQKQITASTVPADPASQPPAPIKQFSSEEFKKLYRSVNYPNTKEFTTPPIITGSEPADLNIHQLAKARGFKLTSQPVSSIIRSVEPGTTINEDDLLQPLAHGSWIKLKAAAAQAGVPLKMLSGYRSPQTQKDLFIKRLSANGASTESIASGQADQLVVKTLYMTAPPGYSRHHTGYTIDFACGSNETKFENSPCFDWLGADNYAQAKAYGWIPSYPDGATVQGPEPESWEYVWVGDKLVR